MNTKLIMILSALFLGSVGVVLNFIPAEFASWLEISADPVILQLLGACYFGFAMLNWMSKEGLIGGIYKRPIVIANFSHFMIGAFALMKVSESVTEYSVFGVYVLFALIFGKMMFTHPIKPT